MFLHVFTYRFKCLIRDRQTVFWTLLFPVILATLFNFAFSNLGKGENFKSIPVAVINNKEFQDNIVFRNALFSVSNFEATDNKAQVDSEATDNKAAYDSTDNHNVDNKATDNNATYNSTDNHNIDNKASDNEAQTDASIKSATGTEEKLFNLIVTDKVKADDLLKNSKISGYIFLNSEIILYVKENGLNQTIIKGFLDDFTQSSATAENVLSSNPSAINNGFLKDITERSNLVRDIPISNEKPDKTIIYFYALLAMTCLYGSFWGVREITDIQADLSPQGARINMVPVHKLRILIYDLLAAFVIHSIQIIAVLAYINFVIGVAFGRQLPYILLTCLLGSISGISLGTLTGTAVKSGEGVKTAVLIALNMTFSFLAGMMFVDMKYIIETSVPLIGYISPANLITNAFYSLYYYSTYERFFLSLGILALLSTVFFAVSYLILKRKKYASI